MVCGVFVRNANNTHSDGEKKKEDSALGGVRGVRNECVWMERKEQVPVNAESVCQPGAEGRQAGKGPNIACDC